MGKQHSELSPDLQAFVEAQRIFFVATAPLAIDGHVNLSPKGLDTFRVLGPRRVAYLDLTGSGNETAAHVAENGRLTVMFAAFEGRPQIVRLYCTGRVVTRDTPEWEELSPAFPDLPGARQIVVGDVERVLSSCGYAVPEMAFVADRDTLPRWSTSKGTDGLVAYRREKNRTSLDGLEAPATDAGRWEE
jgi:hypothetical protein